MTLLEKQVLFGTRLGRLLEFCAARGIRAVVGEVQRSAAQAALNAVRKLGIVNSLHRKRLAADLLLYDANWRYLDGTRAGDRTPYAELGAFWKALSTADARCCWGGDFKSADLGHFSIEHEGVR